MTERNRGTAVITGASSGIGAATARRLAAEVFAVVIGARRRERVDEIAAQCGGRGLTLDVTDPESVKRFAADLDECSLLVNNAGLALGLEPVEEIDDEPVEIMWRTNVLGLLRMTRELLPKLEASRSGHIINLGSIAGFEVYAGGSGYTASKHAARAITRTLRLELLGRPIRVTDVAPGLVETEFSIVRFRGDRAKAKQPYEGMKPLTADDIADCIAWAATRPPHVNIDELVVRPVAQASATLVARNQDEGSSGP
jgi:NADP-dependent 3-hydroxy acid dehydrogenase YdfG